MPQKRGENKVRSLHMNAILREQVSLGSKLVKKNGC